MEPVHYGNNKDRPQVTIGDLATYSTVGAGRPKVKVLDIVWEYFRFTHYRMVKVRVTDRSNPIYRTGEVMTVSPIWLDQR